MPEDYRKVSFGLLDNQDICTLATASTKGIPEAATVRYMNDDNFNIYINSGSTYRKYENMKSNPRVAIVVNGQYNDSYYNLQIEGSAEEIPYDDAGHIIDMYTEKYGSSQYLTNNESVFFQIQSDWVRLLVDGGFPPEYEMIVGQGDTDLHSEPSKQ